MEVYKKLLKEYTNKVIDNYEDSFAQDILVDISENGGGFDSLIDEQYEFYFNVDLSKDLQNIIENLLDDEYNEKDQKKKDKYYKLVLEFIKLKRIADKRILESKAYDEEWVNEFIFDKNPQKKIETTLPIQLNNKLLNPETLINDLYTFLSENDYIKCSIDQFKNRFLGNITEKKNKILWISKQSEMAAFMQLIFNYDIISKNRERKYKVQLSNYHFAFNEPHKEFKSIGKEFSEFKKDETLCPELRKFFEKLNKDGKIKFK